MEHKNINKLAENVIGIVPMAGLAKRLDRLPCSKEIHPINADPGASQKGNTPQVVCEHLLGKLQLAGITNVYIVLRDGKWDIPSYLGDGSAMGLNLAYLMMGLPYGTPYSIDQAYPFLGEATVALGFPDMILGNGDFFMQLLSHQKNRNVDVVLGLFPANRPDKVDMVDIGLDNRVTRITIKPGDSQLQYTWGVAVWSPIFSRYMHNYLALHKNIANSEPEIFLGDIIQSAIEHGMRIDGVHVCNKPYIDIGTKEDLKKATAAITS